MNVEQLEHPQHTEVLLSNHKEDTTPVSVLTMVKDPPSQQESASEWSIFPRIREACMKNKLRSYLLIRITLRILIVVGMVLLVSLLKWDLPEWLRKYGRVISMEGGPIWGGLLFTACATVFCSISPLGYLPAVITGMVFPFYLSPWITWVSVYVGSVLNAILIRKLNKFEIISGIVDCLIGTKKGRIAYLESALHSSHALKIIVLLRVPFLSNGTLNYLLSLSTVPLSTLIKANGIGFIPGSILFSLFGRQVRSLLTMVYHPKSTTVSEWALSLTVMVSALCCYGFVIWKVRKLIKEEAAQFNDETVDDASDVDVDPPHFEFETINAVEQSPSLNESDPEIMQ